MAAATPEQLLGHSSAIFVAHAIEIANMDHRPQDLRTIGGDLGRVELVLEVDEPLGYGCLRSQGTASSDFPSKGELVKAVHFVTDIPDRKQLYCEDLGNWGLRAGRVLMVRPEREPLQQLEIEHVFKDRQLIFSFSPSLHEDKPGGVKVWDIKVRDWAVSAIKANFVNVPAEYPLPR